MLVGANAEPDEAATSVAAAAKRALRLKSIVLADGVLWWVRVAKCLLRGDNIMATTLIIGLWGYFFWSCQGLRRLVRKSRLRRVRVLFPHFWFCDVCCKSHSNS